MAQGLEEFMNIKLEIVVSTVITKMKDKQQKYLDTCTFGKAKMYFYKWKDWNIILHLYKRQ